MDEKRNYVCQACKSSKLIFGYLGGAANVFVPSGIFTMNGFKTRTFVCLECGQLGQFISTDKLVKLREKFSTLQAEE